MNKQFYFPTYQQMYIGERRKLKRFRQYIRYSFTTLYCHKEIKQFEDYINQNTKFIPLFSSYYYRVNALLYKYCDNRFHKQQRLNKICETLTLAHQFLGENNIDLLLEKQKILIFQCTDEIALYLNINPLDPLEGFFSINLQKGNERLYDASFALFEPNQLLIASIQGKKGDTAAEEIKWATKQLHGIRPAFLLVYIFKMLCEIKQFQLLGIPKKHQAKYRFNDFSRILFDYDAFWLENGGALKENYWYMPNIIERKSMGDIPSKKRSMYKKRYEMLDEIQKNLINIFQAA
ncbi:MAG: DUF535 family protein [Neisseriaceae bacterium]|nr:DUF535 family protein [Neisseriaceae bacterium]